MATRRQLVRSLTVVALAGVASAQLPERKLIPFPAAQPDVKTPAPIEIAPLPSAEAPRTALTDATPTVRADTEKLTFLPAGIVFIADNRSDRRNFAE